MSLQNSNDELVQNEIARLLQIKEKLKVFDEDFPQEVGDFDGKIHNLEQGYKHTLQENRLLTIAIVGQVKAGKSSFLNAILFDGDGVLPEAATPMTAALTEIEYGEEFKAEVQYYEAQEWQNIVEMAHKYNQLITKARAEWVEHSQAGGTFGTSQNLPEPSAQELERREGIHDDVIAAHEVYEMSKRIPEFKSKLGQTETIQGVDSAQDLIGRLADYVGSKGTYTPIVRSTKIYYKDEMIKGVRVVDTPGFNDPVVSRGCATKNFLSKADVVFVLSKAAQFISHSDMDLIGQNLPESGVSEIVLVGSQFDAELKGEKNKYRQSEDPIQNLKALINGIALTLKDRVETDFDKLLAKSGDNDRSHQHLLRLKSALPPLFTSSMAFRIAKHFEDLSETEKYYLGELNGLYPGLEMNPDLLFGLSMIDPVLDRLDEVKERKEEILGQKLSALMQGTQEGIQNSLDTLRERLLTRIDKVKNSDLATLQKQEKSMSERLTKGKGKVDLVFETAIADVETKFAELKTDVQGLKSQYQNLNVQTDSYSENYTTYESHGGTGLKDFLFGKKKVERTRSISYKYAEVHDAIDQVERFAIECQRSLQNTIKTLVNLDVLREHVREAAAGLFDPGDPDFDPDIINIPLSRAVNKIRVPDADFGDRDYVKKIANKFGSTAQGNQIEQLREAQRNAIREVLTDLESLVKSKTQQIVQALSQTKNDFVGDLIKDLNTELNQVRKGLENQGETLSRLEKLKNELGGIV